MARYVTTVHTPRPPDEAFAFMADIEGFARWDPGISHARRVGGVDGVPGATYDLTIAGWPSTVLRYTVTDADAPRRLRLTCATATLRSIDDISVAPADGGARVTYDARLELRGPLRWFDPILARVFRRIGDRAASGLTAALATR
jgi:carbon monoxide dehydrogenase subunit G